MNIIDAGHIIIPFDTPYYHSQITTIESIKPYIQSGRQLEILQLIYRLEKSHIIGTNCTLLDTMLCSIQIRVFLNKSNEPSKFLDLMLFVNRSPDPTAEFQSTMDIPSTSSLLDIFIHLPSPHIDHHLSDWCKNPDILEFLNEDIRVEIPGMKTRLYTYQKVKERKSSLGDNATQLFYIALFMEDIAKRISSLHSGVV